MKRPITLVQICLCTILGACAVGHQFGGPTNRSAAEIMVENENPNYVAYLLYGDAIDSYRMEKAAKLSDDELSKRLELWNKREASAGLISPLERGTNRVLRARYLVVLDCQGHLKERTFDFNEIKRTIVLKKDCAIVELSER